MATGRDNDDLIAGLIDIGILSMREAATMVKDFDKPAGARCPHQRHHKGCAIYERRPLGCRLWVCRWLAEDDTADLSRPDRSHYVVDAAPDYVTSDGAVIPVIQVWCDPDYPDAHEDPALRAFLERRAHEGYAALIRLSPMNCFALFAPPFTGDGTWKIKRGDIVEREHTAADKVRALGNMTITMKAAS
jgi:hypothetical protein